MGHQSAQFSLYIGLQSPAAALGRLSTPGLDSREQSRSSSFPSPTQRPLFASLTDRNSPFAVKRSRKGNSQALQTPLLFVLGTVLSREVEKRKSDVKKI